MSRPFTNVARGGILISPLMATKLLREFKTQEPAAENVASGVQTPPPIEAEVAPEEENRPVVEQAPSELPQDTAEPSLEETESLGALPGSTGGDFVGSEYVSDADLVLPSPLEPRTILKFHHWLTEATQGGVQKITASWGGDTVITLSLREPMHLLGMLAELPDVAEVIEEPYVGDTLEASEGLASPSERQTGVEAPMPRQFRVSLKAESSEQPA